MTENIIDKTHNTTIISGALYSAQGVHHTRDTSYDRLAAVMQVQAYMYAYVYIAQ